jgi:hypothetical protein
LVSFAGAEAFEMSRRTGHGLLAAEAIFVLCANVLYFAAASKLYG